MSFDWYLISMILISGGFLAFFLYRPLKVHISDDASNIAIGKQKRQELADDLTKDLIDRSAYQQAEDEITRTLAGELNQDSGEIVAINPLKWTVVLCVVIGVFSILTFDQLTSKSDPAPSLGQEVKTLEVYLDENPQDAKAWKMLGLVEFNSGNIDQAIAAFERAYLLIPDDIDMLLKYSGVLASVQNGDFSGKPQALINQANKVDPNSVPVLNLMGLVAANNGDFVLAEKSWRRALRLLSDEDPNRSVIEDALDRLNNFELESNLSLSINIVISKEVLASRSDQDYLMVYAKATSGSSMPIAIKKIQLKDFTGVVSLSNADSLSSKLFDSAEVRIIARLSSSGLAVMQAGDVEVASKVISLAETRMIDLQVEYNK